ncbi:cadherin EGF LAG seven-pass G-type receptor 3 [Pleurodeles waltl]|uniref:cadherin EGF LAG seven-pass G-type receptor 3 n=1 Tax=Pleurodeles waltl TaxID=8319 RepID=UPI0037099875
MGPSLPARLPLLLVLLSPLFAVSLGGPVEAQEAAGVEEPSGAWSTEGGRGSPGSAGGGSSVGGEEPPRTDGDRRPPGAGLGEGSLGSQEGLVLEGAGGSLGAEGPLGHRRLVDAAEPRGAQGLVGEGKEGLPIGAQGLMDAERPLGVFGYVGGTMGYEGAGGAQALGEGPRSVIGFVDEEGSTGERGAEASVGEEGFIVLEKTGFSMNQAGLGAEGTLKDDDSLGAEGSGSTRGSVISLSPVGAGYSPGDSTVSGNSKGAGGVTGARLKNTWSLCPLRQKSGPLQQKSSNGMPRGLWPTLESSKTIQDICSVLQAQSTLAVSHLCEFTPCVSSCTESLLPGSHRFRRKLCLAVHFGRNMLQKPRRISSLCCFHHQRARAKQGDLPRTTEFPPMGGFVSPSKTKQDGRMDRDRGMRSSFCWHWTVNSYVMSSEPREGWASSSSYSLGIDVENLISEHCKPASTDLTDYFLAPSNNNRNWTLFPVVVMQRFGTERHPLNSGRFNCKRSSLLLRAGPDCTIVFLAPSVSYRCPPEYGQKGSGVVQGESERKCQMPWQIYFPSIFAICHLNSSCIRCENCSHCEARWEPALHGGVGRCHPGIDRGRLRSARNGDPTGACLIHTVHVCCRRRSAACCFSSGSVKRCITRCVKRREGKPPRSVGVCICALCMVGSSHAGTCGCPVLQVKPQLPPAPKASPVNNLHCPCFSGGAVHLGECVPFMHCPEGCLGSLGEAWASLEANQHCNLLLGGCVKTPAAVNSRRRAGEGRQADAASAPAWGTATKLGRQPDPAAQEGEHYLPFCIFNSPAGCLGCSFHGMEMAKHLGIDLCSHLQLQPSGAVPDDAFPSSHHSLSQGVGEKSRGGRRQRGTRSLIRARRAANRHPHFPQYNYQVQVAENQPPGTPVITIAAQDPDPGDGGRLFYSMDALMNSKSLELFTIDSGTGLISTVEILDRENMDLHYFRVTAVDHGAPRLSATTMVAITVGDRNDHSPVFEQAEYREAIRENVEEGYPILQLRATDGDSPANANIRYRFVNEQAAHSVFEIDPRSGLITTSGQVDRETMEKYSLIVEANDQGTEPGPRSATSKVYITVLDENDNAPQFSEKRYIVQVREDIRPHTEILRVTATDVDKDNNALVHYNIISGNSRGQFSIDSITGEIQVVAPLDFEVEREYTLRVRAQDAGRPPQSNNTGMISIQVVDINDHAPIFVSTPFQVSVLENAPLGHSVIHIQAVDADYGENARMEYKLSGVSANTPFVINSATGWITVSGALDRETVEHYFFGVEARDHGTPALSASASVTITVMDVNDNRPEFTQKEYHIRLNEDAVVGTNVLSVTAVDKDVNSAISYQITGGNVRNRFAISTQGGVGLITLSLPLDYKQERRYVLTVTASDRTLHDNCYVHINITDANTHRPVFQSAHYSVNVNEDRPIGSTVVMISATDEDVGENARITYHLEDNIPQFRIDAGSGAITLHAPLDYEGQMTYTLAITAKDNGIPQKSDTTYVEIMVNDVNDNAPQFVSAHYQGTVSEDALPFTSVLQISATDRDAHANGRVQYTFQNGEDGDGDFTIEPTSGIIRTVRRLDRETVPVYELTAYAVDRGIPPQKSPVRIQVTVQDVNDNAPIFPADEFEVYVRENSIVGSVVAKITATDPDQGPNAQIMYQIVEGNIPENFQMDIFTGELTSLIDLDYEGKAEYVIVVQATSAPLVSRATVHIKLVDQNDNSPVLKNFQILFNNYISNSSNTFPSGVIGKIPAYDPDVSDRLFYTFERGNELNLLIVNQTSGELRLSRKLDNNRPLVASMLVTVTDGIHSVTAQCVLRVIIITEDMLLNSITVRLENMSQERFLSPLLTSFLEGVATVLATPKEDVFIFNIQNDTDVGGAILNVSFSALVPTGVRGQFFSSEDLQEQLYMKRMALTSVSMLEVLPFDDNVCLREPCENYMKCISVLKFDSSAPFISSESILFRPIHPITGLRCRCPQGFTGDYCEMEINLCYSNPCQNGGVCARREGGYTCICQQQFSGDNCEVDSKVGFCFPGVCRNGGTCTNLPEGGFQCQCPSGGFEKPYCELSTRSFPPNSFVMFRGLRQRFHMSLSLSFATLERSGLLFYNGRLNEKHDFIAVEIIDGQVHLKYSTGESTTLVSPFLPGGVSDGQWHTVQLRYYNKPKLGSMGTAQGPSKEKVAILAVDDCDMPVALQFARESTNYSCAAEGVQSSSKKSLDLTGPLLLGGVPNLPENFPVVHKEFVGCMRDLYIDSKKIDLASYIANNGTSAGCHAKHSFCDSNPCKNGGSCSVAWGTFTCQCPLGFGGKECRHAMLHPHRFHGNSSLSWDFKSEVKISVPWFLGMTFRTRQPGGTLLQAHAGQYTTILCQLVSGLLSFSVNRGSSRTNTLLLDQMMLNDGKWHDLQLELRDVRSGRETRYIITVNLDFGFYQDTVVVGNELHGLKVKYLHVGGLLESGEVRNGMEGCIQGVRLGDTPAGITLPKPSSSLNVEAGCVVPNPCDSSPCRPNSVCRDEWGAFTCVCEPGFYGETCVDICQLNPCENKALCRRKPGSPKGYVCECGGNHFGQYCEHRMDLQCPKGWWGNPSCGPCSCDVSKGFDPDCNKTNGQCHCKEFHYHPKGSDTCLPCDCYPIGSSSRSCDQETGQCQCRPGVIGRQCNSCDSPFAEVTPSGCEVIYDGCPKILRAGVWWPRVKFGLPAAVPCPKGSLGSAIRHCDVDKGWQEPDLFNCTSPHFMELIAQLESLEKNETELNTIEAKKLAHRLRAITDQMALFFGNDVQITYRLLSRLMDFESKQRGFGLTATQDAHFNENLLRVGSSLLALENKEHWNTLLQSEYGSSGLMDQLREYTSTLARNMKQTYLNPVGLVTPNIMLTIDRMENHTHTRRRFPRYHSYLFRGQSAWDPHTHIVLPLSVLMPPRVEAPPTARPTLTSSEANATLEISPPKKTIPEPEPAVTIIILLIYRTLGGLLPARYSTDRRSIRLPKNPVMNSPIISVSVFKNHTFLKGVLDSPLMLEFRLLETVNRSKPLCVQWNHTSRVGVLGSWTARDCDLVYRNTTHVHCQCSQLGTFGVLMDSSQREQLEGDLETLAIVTYSTLSISLVALLLTFIILACLKGLKSNTRGIHSNIAVALFFCEMVFLLGINRTENQLLCTVTAILLHYFFLSTFAWLFVEGLHIYRMQTEVRNVNYGPMRFYYAIGWGASAIITGLAVGLDPEGYGNPDFCWISVHDKLLWSFAGPIALVIVINGVMFLMVAKLLCSPGQKETKKKSVLMTLRGSFILLLFISTTWLFGLLAVNNSVLAFHYLYSILCCVQGLAVLVMFCVLNKEVQEAWKLACLGKKSPGEEAARPAQKMGPNNHNNTSLFEESGLIRITLGASTVSSVSSVRSARTHSSQRGYLRDNMGARQGATLDHTLLGHSGPTDLDVAMFHRDAGGGQDSDTDSDLSLDEERSLSIPSSESEENVRLRGRFQRQFKRAAHSERLLSNAANSSPKDVDGNDLMSYWPALGECEVHPCSLQKWGSERKLGLDMNKDAANNNQPELTSGDENSLTHSQRQRKGILKNRLQYPPTLQGLSSMGRMTNELSWYKTSTLGHRAVPAASYGRMYSGTGSLSQPASRYSSREQLDMLMRRQMSKEQISRNNSRELLETVPSRHGSREHLDSIPSRHASREQLNSIPSRHGSREHLESIPSRHGSRENLEMSSITNDKMNSLSRRQGSRDHFDSLQSRYGSKEHIDCGQAREVPREWLNNLPSRQISRDRMDTSPNQQTSREPTDLLSRRQPSRDQLASTRQNSREQLDFLSRRSNSREHLDTVPSTLPSRENLDQLSQRQPSRENLELLSRRLPSRDNFEPLSKRQPSRENLEAISSRHPSTEQLDILSSILASFNSSVLSSVQSSTTPSAPQTSTTPSAVQNSTPSVLCPSTPHSATSHSISELSPDSEVVRSEGQS